MVAKAQRHDRERIVEDPAILAGKPVVRGTRIPVGVVLDYLANNPNFNDLFADYPRLTLEDVKACLRSLGLSLRTPPGQKVARVFRPPRLACEVPAR